MSSGKSIRAKIKSVNGTKKIMRAMEMVSTSKLKKAQERMKAARPYAEKIRHMASHMASILLDEPHPYLAPPESPQSQVGLIVISSNKGLCGSLNSQLFRKILGFCQEEQKRGFGVSVSVLGSKAANFFRRLSFPILSVVTPSGDHPPLDQVLGPILMMSERFVAAEFSSVYLCYNRFVSTMKQEPVIEPLLPVPPMSFISDISHKAATHVFEPESRPVCDTVMKRYIECVFYEAVLENISAEHSARMLAMKTAYDNASEIVKSLNLAYNKARQAAITKELAEIVGGAAAV